MFNSITTSHDTLLSRLREESLEEVPLSTAQQTIQQSVGTFFNEAARWQTLGAVFTGTSLHRFVRVGTSTLLAGLPAVPLHFLSQGAALLAEASGFEISQRCFQRLSGHEVSFRWEGADGLGRALYTNILNFG